MLTTSCTPVYNVARRLFADPVHRNDVFYERIFSEAFMLPCFLADLFTQHGNRMQRHTTVGS